LTSQAYRSSGVNLDEMDTLKEKIKAFASATHGPEVLNPEGGFAGLFRLNGFKQPVLVASTDGVGTKIKIATQLGHYESIGQDLVTLNVNDILARGAKPLFFLDYVSFTTLDQQVMETLLRGIAWGCREVGCALIGGETAQMPGPDGSDHLELVGFVVGAAEPDGLFDESSIQPGDCLVGFPSSGLHTNGFSLVRSVFNSDADPTVLYRRYDGLQHNLGEELLVRHRCYYPMLEPVLNKFKGLSHITGGGLPGKMPAILPDDLAAAFRPGTWTVPPIFEVIQREGKVELDEMYRVFNMGLGMVAVCAEDDLAAITEKIPDSRIVGRVIQRGDGPQVTFSEG
jgi:phosphoribosylformylglycinamidine cyclo-ligase